MLSQFRNPRDDLHADIVLWLLSRLWKNKNELLYKGREFLRKAQEDLEEWQARKRGFTKEAERTGVQSTTISNQRHCWTPPPTGWIKCNSDGAWDKKRDMSGLGWICRDEQGFFLWAGARSVTSSASAIVAEAEALKWAAETLRFGYTNIIFESDAQVLVKMSNGEKQVWPLLKPTIEAI